MPPDRPTYPLLRGHDPTAECSGLIHPADAYCTCMATFRSAAGTGVVISTHWQAVYEAGGSSLTVRPPEPRRTTTMRSRSRDRLLTLAITVAVLVVLALFALPWVYIATTASGDIGATVIWTGGVEVVIVGTAAVIGIILLLSDN